METIQDTKENLEKKAAEIIESKIKQLSESQDKIILAIPGGRSVSGVFQLLKNSSINWNKVHIFMIDERRVPITDNDSNFKLANDILLKELPPTNIHPYTEKHTPEDYTEELKSIKEKIDIVILSSGEDGHIAALYPNHHSIANPSLGFFSLDDSPKLPPKRVTASKQLIKSSELSILLFMGESKKQAFQTFQNKDTTENDCPAIIVKDIKESYVLATK